MPGENSEHGGWRLYGAATDGSIREFTASLGNESIKHEMNQINQYYSIDICRNGHTTLLAGLLPVIEIWGADKKSN